MQGTTTTSQRDFAAFPKIPRLRRDVLITEKIDGTNGCIVITDDGDVYAQSRTRIITPRDDNFGFASWVDEHSDTLRLLGPGRHYGEWWGLGIQRGYGLTEKRFSLFNVHRWREEMPPRCWREGLPLVMESIGVSTVPVIGSGPLTDGTIDWALVRLRVEGSSAAPGFMKPEGIVVMHTQSRALFKVLLENDEQPKGATA